MLENITLVKSVDPVKQTSEGFFIPDLCAGRAVFVLVLVSELCVLAMVLAATGVKAFSWDYLALVSLFVQWVVLSSALLLCTLRDRLATLALPAAVTAAYAIVLGVTLVLSIAASWIMAGAQLSGTGWRIDGPVILRNLVISAIMTGLVLRYFYVHSRLRSQEKAELQARIQALQSRIRPHFLFNSMNSIASLIRSAPETAEQAVEDLCELFRASLKEADQPIGLHQEIDLCKRYVGIEQLRLGDRLEVDWRIGESLDSASIPMLTLQPILENAIYHGIQPLPEGGKIGVLVELQGGEVSITVSNPVTTGSPANGDGNHIALDNIRSRLHAFYGAKAMLATHVADGIFVTRLQYPQLQVSADG